MSSDIKGSEDSKAQLDGELKQHKSDRAAAKASVRDATALREKEVAAFAASAADHTSNIGALKKLGAVFVLFLYMFLLVFFPCSCCCSCCFVCCCCCFPFYLLLFNKGWFSGS